METVDTRSRKQKFEDWKFNTKTKLHDAGQRFSKWTVDHVQEIVIWSTIGGTAAGLAAKGIHDVVKTNQISKQEKLQNEYCYDRSLGHYWALKRTPSNQEWVEIDRRKRNGERLADILSDMRLLK